VRRSVAGDVRRVFAKPRQNDKPAALSACCQPNQELSLSRLGDEAFVVTSRERREQVFAARLEQRSLVIPRHIVKIDAVESQRGIFVQPGDVPVDVRGRSYRAKDLIPNNAGTRQIECCRGSKIGKLLRWYGAHGLEGHRRATQGHSEPAPRESRVPLTFAPGIKMIRAHRCSESGVSRHRDVSSAPMARIAHGNSGSRSGDGFSAFRRRRVMPLWT
jgi:hypothetical protein